jgi:methionine transaminase
VIPLPLPSRLPEVGVSIFSRMSKLALEENAINLSQGFPDFPVSEELMDLIYVNMKRGHNQYAPMPGVPVLRQAIAQVVEQTYQRPTDAEQEVTITAGGTEALFAAIAACVRPGDEVLMFDPAYDSYDPAIRLNGGIPVHIHLNPPQFAIDWSEVKNKISSRTRMILINSPHNPTGAVLSAKDLEELQEIVLRHPMIILSDEVYERLIFDGHHHHSVLAYPLLKDRSIAVFSFGKTFHATGWKVGYVVASTALTQEIRKTHQFITFSVNTPVQWALADYLKNPANYNGLGNFYQQKRDFFLKQIEGSSFRPLPCHGSYFQLLAFTGPRSDREMAEHLTRVHKVAPIPVSAFYKDGSDHQLLRFCFAKKEETLQQAGDILRKI